MCIAAAAAIPIAEFALAAVSTGVGLYAQQQTYNAKAEAYTQNADNAREAQANANAQLANRLEQEKASVVQDKFENQIAARKARSTAIATAGEANVSGLSVDSLLADYYSQEGRYNSAVDTNFNYTQNYLRGEYNTNRTNAQNQINSMPRPEAPSYLGAALRVVGAGLDAFGNYKANTDPAYSNYRRT